MFREGDTWGHANIDFFTKRPQDGFFSAFIGLIIFVCFITQESDIQTKNWYEKHVGKNIRDMIERNNPFEIHDSSINKKRSYFMGYFKKDRLDMYVGHEKKETFFSRTERSRMVEGVCREIRFGDERYDVGIKKLLHEQIYVAAYPLHPGSEECPEGERPTNSRQKLRREWAPYICVTERKEAVFCTYRKNYVSIFGKERHNVACSIVRDTNLVVVARVQFKTAQLWR